MDFLLPKVGEAPQEEVYLIFILYAGSDGYIYEVELGINSGVDLSVYDFDELCSRLRRCKLDFDRNYRAFVHARCVRANITINRWESWVEWMKLEKQELKEGKE